MKKTFLTLISLFCFSNISQSTEAFNYEIRTAPIALLARWGTLDFSLNINTQWALGPSVIIYAAPKVGQMFAPSYSGTAIGGHLYYYLNSFSENSWYWGNHLYAESYQSYPHAMNGHYEYSGYKLNSKFGYQFTHSSGFNMLLGAGAELRNYAQKNIDDSSGANTPSFNDYQPVIPFIEMKFGYKF